MGQRLSCRSTPEQDEFVLAVESGEVDLFEDAVGANPALLHHTTVYHRLSALHLSAAYGRVEVLCMILNRSVNPDLLNRHKQTPLMLAAMHGKVACVQRLIQAGANILMFDSLRGRTCLHYAAYHGHTDCLGAILLAARSTSVAASWGFARFVNVRDDNGATSLHLASKRRRPDCVRVLLESGALACASTGSYCFPGSAPLHLAARSESIDCVRELLAWGADRLQRDSSGRIPFVVALRRKNKTCAALLDPTSSEPIVWPSPLKFISELNPEAKVLLMTALMEANKAREIKILKGAESSQPSPSYSDDVIDDESSEGENEMCCICFDQLCAIEVRNCGHQMCASCTLALCCHSKPDPETSLVPAPVCPFCRSNIARLVVASRITKTDDASTQMRSDRFRNSNGGSNSVKGLTSSMGSFGKHGHGSGRILDDSLMNDKS